MKSDSIFVVEYISYCGTEHRHIEGYRYSREECHVLLEALGYTKNVNFRDKDIWEHKKDDDYDVWKYVEIKEVKKLEIK